ncbi:type IX secretion system outer membrane channel protein PorV [Sphingobacterium sp. xlx-130]|uniref:type IX secretion system outer membrane channel protein PorV n=1 Tax=Sphingobacterium sp. xlx-130 TaxID=2654323 RepID=UPI0013D9E0D8|nr:type IX secretion system outer membrane channel protein PorV [Sphingobacterium sp. xlx-130]
MNRLIRYLALLISSLVHWLYLLLSPLYGQVLPDGGDRGNVRIAVPFLRIAPDTRSSGMGDVGVATRPDVNSIFWNSAKYGAIEDKFAIAAHYTPWLRNVVSDVRLMSMASHYRLSERHTLAGGLRFFSWGDINFTDQQGQYVQLVKPTEFAIDIAYAYRLTDGLALSITPRYIHSRLSAQDIGYDIGGSSAFAMDLGFYAHHALSLGQRASRMNYGLSVSNIGSPMTYGMDKEALPTNLKAGAGLDYGLDEASRLSFSVDINRLLVADNDRQAEKASELSRYSLATGVEWDYNNQFALRAGYFHSQPQYGNRKYFTAGATIGYGEWSFGTSYVLPTGRINPLANTLRFTISYRWSEYGL